MLAKKYDSGKRKPESTASREFPEATIPEIDAKGVSNGKGGEQWDHHAVMGCGRCAHRCAWGVGTKHTTMHAVAGT